MSADSRLGALCVGAVFLVGVAAAAVLLRQDPPHPSARGSQGKAEISSLLLRPTSAFFGETISADANVVALGVERGRIAVRPDFRPYSVVSASRTQQTLPGNRTMLRLHWTLQCLHVRCLARDGRQAVYSFPVILTAGGSAADSAVFPQLLVVSRLASGGTRMRNEILLEDPQARSMPGTAVVSVGALGLLGIAALLLLAPFRARVPTGLKGDADASRALREAIERAEDRRVTVTLAEQRGALDHLARAVATEDPDLAEAARALAWGKTEPTDSSIARLLERARSLLR